MYSQILDAYEKFIRKSAVHQSQAVERGNPKIIHDQIKHAIHNAAQESLEHKILN